jgi:hypothetical protein
MKFISAWEAFSLLETMRSPYTTELKSIVWLLKKEIIENS